MLDEDRLMLDRSPDEMEADDLDALDSDEDGDDGTIGGGSDGERIIYPWMKKIHVAGVGSYIKFFLHFFNSKNYGFSSI